MKNLKLFLIVIMLIGILTTSIFLCACNKDSGTDGIPSGSMPSGNPSISSGEPTTEQPPSGEPTTEQPPSGEPEEPSLKNADWINIYTFRSSLKEIIYSTILKSLEDLLAICDEDSSPVFENDQYSSNKDGIEILKAYGEEFFQDKSLVAIFIYQDICDDCYVKDFEIDGESLNVTVINEVRAGVTYPAKVFNCVYLLEFPKEQVKDVTQINAIVKHVVKK